ncbi:MAG TPA: ABC-type transport auxiliary lipoprotein family protein [Thermohalobaculum sp.]|nr:ABC-type transport auxiliary lipoprotein family protein [Thermohalobaculum sp.]
MAAVFARVRRVAFLVAGLASLTGCAGLDTLRSVTEPTDLYDLTPKSTYAADLPRISAQIVIEEPTAASSVNTDRIAIKPNPYQVQYFPQARWVDRAPLLVQTMLLESFENTGKVGAVGRQAIGLSSDYTLLTELREFQAALDGGETGPITVIVQLNMKIVQEPLGLIVASQSFAHRETAASSEMLSVVAAFDTALGKTMGQTVDWAVRRIAQITN